MDYSLLDFLEIFDQQEIIDEEARIHKYTITSQEGTRFSVFMSILEGYMCFSLTTAGNDGVVTFTLNNVISVICDKNKPEAVRFLFYQKDKKYPTLTAWVKPDIALELNIDQVE